MSLGSEDRLLQFSELIATALANAEAREELQRVAEEQAALRRVATLVAEAAPPSAVFASVAEEVGRLLAVDGAAVRRYLADGTGEILAAWNRSGRGHTGRAPGRVRRGHRDVNRPSDQAPSSGGSVQRPRGRGRA